jgi:lipopolysaccharide export system permease protein
MLKRIDKLVLGAFWGPFLVTFAVTEFIFLTRFILLYFEEIAGKDIGLATYGQLFWYFGLIMVPLSMPLAVLLSSLMCFGNLGEFSELTAIKSAGISITRAIRPVLLICVGITGFIFWFSNQVQPWANLKGYSLLYDIKMTKATMNIKEGIFYNELPRRSLKVAKKFPDNKTLKGLVIYDHTDSNGNRRVITADSAQMYTILGNKYLVFELFDGYDYTEDVDKTSPNVNQTDFTRNAFKHARQVIDLRAFEMSRTDEDQFRSHAIMKDIAELGEASDSLRKDLTQSRKNTVVSSPQYYQYHMSAQRTQRDTLQGSWVDSLLQKKAPIYQQAQWMSNALSSAKTRLSSIETDLVILGDKEKQIYRNDLEWHHKFTQAVACLVMFLIGAPLGAIIKKGGFGLPVLVAIIFFILMYVITIQGDKMAKEGVAWVPLAAWLSNAVLFGFGVFFLIKAINDSRLFEADVYRIAFNRWRGRVQEWRRTTPWLQKKVKVSGGE